MHLTLWDVERESIENVRLVKSFIKTATMHTLSTGVRDYSLQKCAKNLNTSVQ